MPRGAATLAALITAASQNCTNPAAFCALDSNSSDPTNASLASQPYSDTELQTCAADLTFKGKSTFKIAETTVVGTRALFNTVGQDCDSTGQCTTNTDPTLGMPDSAADFDTAFEQAVDNDNPFWAQPCQEIAGRWYLVNDDDGSG